LDSRFSVTWRSGKSRYSPRIKVAALQCYRIAVLLVIAWLIRSHHERLRVEGDWPVTVAEVKVFLPEATRLKVDAGPRAGFEVFDWSATKIGYAVRTMPESREIVGYSGPTDVLAVFDAEDKGVGIAIRHSYDTPSHVDDVKGDFLFMEKWNGRLWDEVAAITDLGEANIYGVSGATRTSEAVALSITHRLALANGSEGLSIPFRPEWRDGLLVAFLAGGCVFAFLKAKSVQRWRWVYSLATIAILGLWMGDLIAQSLLTGWVESRVPWETTPGLVLFVFAAFLLPWFTKQPVYCQFICPHGNLQRWTMKWLPARWKRPLPDDGKWIGKLIPVMLLLLVLAVTFLQLDFDLAGIEPFDAYLLKGAGLATIVVALSGIALSLLFPMAYCKFGCPTGWLLEFVRRRSGKDHFSDRDWVGLLLLAVAIAFYWIPISTFLG
jgi:NosR/NirI family nitrous oxide reductase transcriptional regulator